MRAAQEKLNVSRQREQAATQAATAERRATEVAEGTARAGHHGIDTKMLGKPNEIYGEDEKWFEWATVFRCMREAAILFVDERVNLIEIDQQARHPNALLKLDLAQRRANFFVCST